jgi:predicted enzyme related to lactoylglutathione lyase
MDEAMKIKMFCITLDCNDSQKLADFYAALLDWEKGYNDDGWAWVTGPEKYPFILFQQVEDYKTPIWPQKSDSQQPMAHIDFAVNDLEVAVQHAIKCGAKIATEQFSDMWKVMIDPAGHPFCLCPKKTIFTVTK